LVVGSAEGFDVGASLGEADGLGGGRVEVQEEAQNGPR
jgi:hypothetical protein